MEEKVPPTLAGFKILRVLGKGAGSVVYEATDVGGARFALKHTPRKSAADDRHVLQALHEYEVARVFNHANIRRVYRLIHERAVGTVKEMIKHRSPLITNDVFVVMEMVEGETLEQHPIHDLVVVCKIFLQVAAGLTAMHEAGYVHADLKPANIMFTKTGTVKLIDLGLSCRAGHTRTRINGTPGYISPEQVLRKPVTPQTDIFSFGATMYNMLTTRLIPTMLKVRVQPGVKTADGKEFPTPRELNSSIPPALSSLIMTCVRTKPEDRPASIADVHARLWMSINQLPDNKEPVPTPG